jgi:hypothetical protein
MTPHVLIAAVALALVALHIRCVHRNYHDRGLSLKASWWGPLASVMGKPETEGDAQVFDLRQGPTHVLHWLPGFLAEDGRGSWALQDADAFEAGEPAEDCPETFEAKDADREVLAAWAASQTGCRVVLERGDDITFTSGTVRPMSLNVKLAPVWYVWPVRQP